MLKTFLAALVLVGLGVVGMCFNILFRKKEFPKTEVGENPEMRKLGIRCMREIDDELFNNKKKSKEHCSGNITEDCAGCSFFPYEKH